MELSDNIVAVVHKEKKKSVKAHPIINDKTKQCGDAATVASTSSTVPTMNIQNEISELKESVSLLRNLLESQKTETAGAGSSVCDSLKRKHENDFNFDDSSSDCQEMSGDSDNEFDSFFTDTDKVSDPIDDKLANKIDSALSHTADKEMLNALMEKQLRPKNVNNLKLPKINKEIKLNQANKSLKFKEGRLGKVQSCVGKGLSAVVTLLDKAKKAKKAKDMLSSDLVYNTMADATKLLVTAHKDLSQLRRENLRSLLPQQNREICDAQGYEVIENNDLLFGNDLGKKVEELNKVKKLQTPKNFPRGRPTSASRPHSFPSHQNSWGYKNKRPWQGTQTPPWKKRGSFKGSHKPQQ